MILASGYYSHGITFGLLAGALILFLVLFIMMKVRKR